MILSAKKKKEGFQGQGIFHSTKRVAGQRAILFQQAAGARNPEQKRVSARV